MEKKTKLVFMVGIASHLYQAQCHIQFIVLIYCLPIQSWTSQSFYHLTLNEKITRHVMEKNAPNLRN